MHLLLRQGDQGKVLGDASHGGNPWTLITDISTLVVREEQGRPAETITSKRIVQQISSGPGAE